MRLYQRLLGHPFVYNHVRPFMVGGIELTPFYAGAGVSSGDVVLDLGCGTGNALEYLDHFARYVGIDTDPIAIEAARARHGNRPNVSFECKLCDEGDIASISPSLVVMGGLLHHLDDRQAVDLLRLAAASPKLRRIVTLDIVYLPGREHWVSNAFASLDRGRHCRKPEGYRKLADLAGMRLMHDELVWSHPQSRLVRYFTMTLVG